MNRSAFRFAKPATSLSFDGERFVSGLIGDANSGDIQSEHYHRYLFALQFCVGKDVLDIASGEGYGSACLGQVAASVVGIDANNEAVDFANHNYLNDCVSFKPGKAQAIPIEDASVDVVVSFETIEHFTEHDQFIAEIRRVLRPNGLLLMSSPNRVVYSEEANYHNEWHKRELDRREFLDLLGASFANVAAFAQRPLLGSVISVDDARSEGRPEGFILRGEGVFQRTNGVPHPPFFVALASDAPLPELRSSVLQNPTLVRHLDAQRQQATENAQHAAAHVAELEQVLAETATGLQDTRAALTTVLTERESVTAALDQAQAEAAQAKQHAEQALTTAAEVKAEAQRLHAAAQLAREALVEAARQELAELRRVSAQAAHSENRVETVRQELTAARRRNQELAAEADALRQEVDTLAAKHNVVRQRRPPRNWRSNKLLLRIATSLPPGVRHTLRSGVETGKRLGVVPVPKPVDITTTAPLPPRPNQALDLSAPPPTPSALQRQKNPSWVEPNERAAFIRLRGFTPQAKIAVVVHVFYPELWDELAQAVVNIPEAFDLFVTLVTGASEALEPTIRERFPNAHVLLVDNHGRDIFPMLALIRTGVLFGYELICKVHSKRSTYRAGGDEWRRSLVGGILGSDRLVERILRSFRADPDLGIVVAPGQIFGGRVFWISNEARSLAMFRDLGLNESAFERDFVGGSMYWIRPLILRPINALHLEYDDFEPEPISSDGFTAHAVERLVSVVCYDAGMRIEESSKPTPPRQSASDTKVHVIANYLPQFHPTPENDAWWGKGFTEWTNVTKAQPQFLGHRQPRLPTDLGFYDLRLAEVRAAQAELARIHGVTAFSYYYYWFNGRKLLNHPIEAVVASGEPAFPFMLCWANEPWTRNWDGLSSEILLPQDYSPGWERAFAADVAPIMHDPRYLRLNGAPMLAIYRVAHLPEKRAAIDRLRAAFAEHGIPTLHLIGAWVRIDNDKPLPARAQSLGLDAWFEFPPHETAVPTLDVPATDKDPDFTGTIYDYGATVDGVLDRLALPQSGFRYRGVMMGWDNTARRGARSFAFHGATPTNFRRWLRGALRAARSEAPGAETAVFINAWNEWAEGSYLEPDRDFGTGWLEAVASATMQPATPPLDIAGTVPDVSPARWLALGRDLIGPGGDFDFDAFVARHLQPAVPEHLLRYALGPSENLDSFVRGGAETYLMLELALQRQFGKTIGDFANILDFGCGPGRILRFLDPSTTGVSACDVHEQVVRFVQQHHADVDTIRNGLTPPLAYDSGRFSLIFAIGIFSHLSREAEDQWLAELDRVGEPGCIYLISIHGDWFIESTQGAEAAAMMADGFTWKKVNQRHGTEDDLPEYFEVSFHTSAYIREHWSLYFEIIDIIKGDDPQRYVGPELDPLAVSIAARLRPMGQDLVIARRR